MRLGYRSRRATEQNVRAGAGRRKKADGRAGRAEVAARIAAIRATVDVLAFRVERLVVDGATVLALGRERMRVRATGREWATAWVHVHEVESGCIRRFMEHMDTAAVVAAYAGA